MLEREWDALKQEASRSMTVNSGFSSGSKMDSMIEGEDKIDVILE